VGGRQGRQAAEPELRLAVTDDLHRCGGSLADVDAVDLDAFVGEKALFLARWNTAWFPRT
jgi:hypothetical protein